MHRQAKKIGVTFYQRRTYPSGHYSLEFIFADVRNRLADRIDSRIAICSFFSRGIFRRLFNALEAIFRQGEVNFIAGDIHYVSFFLRKRKTVLMIPDCGFLYDGSGLKRLLLRCFWLTLPLKRVQQVITISEASKADILRNSSCLPDKIAVVPVAIHDKYRHVPKEFNKDKPVLLQVGQASNKNLERIIEAVAGLDVQLMIIGRLSEQNRARLQSQHIDFTNAFNLTDDEMLQRYAECDMLIFPSTYEGFGMPILEAQAVGRAVLTSNTTSMPWVAGEGACLVDPYSVESIRSGIDKIISDDGYRKQLVMNGLENVKRFNPDGIADMYYEAFKSVSGGV